MNTEEVTSILPRAARLSSITMGSQLPPIPEDSDDDTITSSNITVTGDDIANLADFDESPAHIVLKVSVDSATNTLATILERASTPDRPTNPTLPNTEECLCKDWEYFFKEWATLGYAPLDLVNMTPKATQGYQVLCAELELNEDILERSAATILPPPATMTP